MDNVKQLYLDIWNGSIIPRYLTLMTQIEGSEEYLISETLIWHDRFLLNKMYGMFPEVRKIPKAKILKWDCICHTKKEHLEGMKEVGIQKVDETYGQYL